MKNQTSLIILFAIVALLLAACSGPKSLPEGPTPIPTLIPATEMVSLPVSVETPSFTILSYPARPPSAELGQPIYEEHCANCHGTDGEGVVPGARNFNDLDYMRGENPTSFYAVITEGRGEMPPFRNALTSDERWDVLFYLWRFSTNAEILATGKQIYELNCAACHGDNGVGTVLGASDFTDLRYMDNRAPRDFYLTITQGLGSMPAWQGRLSQEERWAVIDYLRTFSYDPGLKEEVESIPQPTVEDVELVCSQDYLSQTNTFNWGDEAAIQAGSAIYEQACGMCHGPDGSGAFPNTPDFTTPEAITNLLVNSGRALCVLAEGSKSMPGWKETLSNDQMWQVLTYMGTFGN
ncbi:MAG TPA: c-type cytochrome [Anaerolineales bacterium]|nr:c-type cytochrome [Anaerolineales bacterium]